MGRVAMPFSKVHIYNYTLIHSLSIFDFITNLLVLATGKNVVLDIEMQGIKQLRNLKKSEFENAVYIFIAVPLPYLITYS